MLAILDEIFCRKTAIENREKEYAPGMRVIIRDEEWIIKQVIHNSLDDLVLFCQGTSISVMNKEVFFLTDMEKNRARQARKDAIGGGHDSAICGRCSEFLESP